MYKELNFLLRKLPLEDLKLALGEDILSLLEYITGDLTKSSLIKISIQVYGKSLLENSNLRTLLILNCLTADKLNKLIIDTGINKGSIPKNINAIGSLPFSLNINTLHFLKSLELSKDYLPDVTLNVDSNFSTIHTSNNFYELLDYQNDLKYRTIKYFREINNARVLLHMPTGAGKTKTAMHILQEYWSFDCNNNGVVFWIAHTETLLRQAIDSFSSVWKILGKKDVDIINFYGDFELPIYSGKNVIIFGGIQKIIAALKKENKNLKSYIKDSKIIILDEAHKAPAKQTYKALKYILNNCSNEQVFMGLTATPGRSSGYDIEDYQLKSLFDGIKMGINLKIMSKYLPECKQFKSVIPYLQYRNILSNFTRKEIKFNPSELKISNLDLVQLKKNIISEKRELNRDLLEKLAKSKKRNFAILQEIKLAFTKNRNIIVFACNVNHARLLSGALQLEDISVGLILGVTPANQRAIIINRFQDPEDELRILINVDVLTTGFDAPNINTLLIARPIASIILYSQIIGRGIRGTLMGGTPECDLIEVVDDFQLGDANWAFKYFDDYWK